MSDENDGDGYGINDNDATTSCIICHTVRRRRKDIGNLDFDSVSAFGMRNAYHEIDSIFDSCFSEQASEHLGFLSIGFPIQPAISMYLRGRRDGSWDSLSERASEHLGKQFFLSFLSCISFSSKHKH
jgi:hypothetical protein